MMDEGNSTKGRHVLSVFLSVGVARLFFFSFMAGLFDIPLKAKAHNTGLQLSVVT